MAVLARRTLVHAGLEFALMTAPDVAPAAPAPRFRAPQINLYSKDIVRAA